MKNLNKVLKQVEKYNKAAAKEIKADIKALQDRLGKDLPDYIDKYNITDDIREDIKDTIRAYYKGVEQIIYTHLYNSIDNTIESVFKETRALLKDKRIPSIPFTADVSKIINSDDTGLTWTDRLDFTRDKAILEVQEAVVKGLKQGNTYRDIAKDIDDRLEVGTSRANRIARTETHRVLSTTRLESYKEIDKATRVNGKPMFYKKWVTAKDERVRDRHSELDGVTIPITDNFEIGGYEAQAPGLFGEPSLDISCRCINVLVRAEDV